MLDIKFIRENKDQVATAAHNKGVSVNIDKLIELDTKRRELQTTVENLRQAHNQLIDAAKSGKPKADDIAKAKALKDKLTAPEAELKEINSQYKELMYQVPNLMHDSVPISEDESGNVVLKSWGTKPKFGFKPKTHMELAQTLDLIDIATATKTSGARFYYLKNSLVQLEFALVQWLLEKYTAKGFTPVTTPQLVKSEMLYATGFFPAEANEIYRVNPESDDLYLIGTSEVTLAGLHMFKPLDKSELPRRYIGFSSCYRREAGSYGKDTLGIFRVHQFDKLEMYSYAHPDKSWEEHDFLLSIEEEILQELKLPYQVVNICSGDLGAPAAKKYDCEVWLPSEQRYRELTSCSNTTDFQARRGNIKFKSKKGTKLVHTLNGTAMASTRTLIAIMENNQTADGQIKVPEVLQKYMGGKTQL